MVHRSRIGIGLVAVLLASTLSLSAQQRPGGKPPEGTKVVRDLPYVENGHPRQKLDLYLPEKADRPVPLIVHVHGGAWLMGGKESASEILPLMARGYAVAAVNYRLSQHAVFPAQIEDCKAAVRWLRANAAKYNLDPERFAAMGGSAGGHLVALLGTTSDVKEFEKGAHLDKSSRVQAVVDLFGPTDFLIMGGSHDGPGSPESKLVGGPIQENKDKVAKANPITYVSKRSSPFLILHGDRDGSVPINQSEALTEALKKAGVDVTFIPVKGAGHGGPQFRSEESMKTIGDFLDRQWKRK